MNVLNGHIIGVHPPHIGGGDTIATSLRRGHHLNRSVQPCLVMFYLSGCLEGLYALQKPPSQLRVHPKSGLLLLFCEYVPRTLPVVGKVRNQNKA